jgi:hypothetical protein
MPGAKLFSLLDKIQVLTLHDCMHLLGFMAGNHDNLCGAERTATVDHMLQQWFASQFMNYLGARRLHARSLACGENDNTQ